MRISDYLRKKELSLIRSAGDGHCLLYSICTSFNQTLFHLPNISVKSLKQLIFTETVSNIDLYTAFCDGLSNSDLVELLNHYLNEHGSNTMYGDLVPLVIARALKVDINIINENSEHVGEAVILPISPDCASVGSITVHRSADHYNGVIPIVHPPTESVENKPPGDAGIS